ncbi:mechanosensitive ion channel family protein [Paenibacillus glacialis]|uniref:Mechanosensitive ion channel protein MscS n=1 Tax=Paenibacillus glacialis TaxID=494026 RepID=A0A162MCD3_9BACL|nr:mechanosensitive ion channel family protein [Paenibacillus glacialis]OAB42053.1 mechanosensitive ion channel protein MscS [Paenibacillus glacialis]
MQNSGTETENAKKVIEEALNFKDRAWNWLTDSDMWMVVLLAAVRIIIIFVLTRLVIKIVYKVIDKTLSHQENSKLRMNPRRFVTVGGLLKNTITVVCNFVMFLIVLSEFNFDLAPLLAGAGVLGLAIGFGAQSVVKDVITGFFIILEDQFAVGDVIQTGTFKGTVEMIGIRTTRIVSHTGEVYVLPNGAITTVTNYSLSNALAIVDIPIKNERNLEQSITLIQQALVDTYEKTPEMISSPNVLGVQSLSTSEYALRIVAECLPATRERVERQIQMDVRQAIEDEEALQLEIMKREEGTGDGT